MKIDCWTHLMPPSYLQALEAAGTGAPGPARFLLEQRALHDLDYRLRLMDTYGDYRQVVAPIPGPHLNVSQTEAVRRNNEEMAEIVRRHADRFAGFVAATPIAEPDAAAEEAIRSVRELGALGVQLEEDPVNLPLHHERYDPLFAAIGGPGRRRLAAPVPHARHARHPGRDRSPPPLAGLRLDGRHHDHHLAARLRGPLRPPPDLKLIAHHGGGLIPHFSGRAERMPAFTAMAADLAEALGRLRKHPLDYFKMLYVDTAMFGSPHGVRCVLDFFGPDHVLFGTDAPFDTEGGSYFIPATISDVEDAADDEALRSAIFAGNASRLLALRAPP